MDLNNNYMNSVINKPYNNEQDNIGISIRNQISLDQLLKENKELEIILNKYDLILKEYQKKYSSDLFYKLEKELLLNEQNEDIYLKKKLLENIPLIKEYEKKIIEKDNQIKFLLNEKAHLETDNLKIREENEKLQNELENVQNQNDEIYKALAERTKSKDNQIKYNKTFSNKININIDKGIQEKEIIEAGDNNINMNSNMEIGKMINTMKNFNDILNKEKMENKEKADLEDIINKMKNENGNFKNKLNNLQNTLKQEMDKMAKLENDLNLKEDTINRLEIDNKNFKNEINQYKGDYESLERRARNDIENYTNELKEIRTYLDDYKNKNKRFEEQNSNYKYENARLKQENESLKFDRDNLTKIIEDSNMVVKNAEEKEKYVDNVIKSYKKKEDEIKLEKEKLNMKLKMKENQINKINADYGILIKEKINSYELLNSITKNNYEDIIKNKDNEIKELKTSILSYKIEKDKYLYDYNLIKSEYDKIYQQFQTENDDYIKKYGEVQNKLNTVSSEYIGTINDLKVIKMNLEEENKIMKSENNEYKINEKKYEKKIKYLEKTENELKMENNELKKNIDSYKKQNSSYIEQINRLNATHKIRTEHDKEDYENQIIHLNNVIENQKKQLNSAEGKALDMVKKQQNLTEKYKKELQNTITYYENIINGRIPENLTTS